MENKFGPGGPSCPPGPLSSTRGRVSVRQSFRLLSTGYFNPIKNLSNRKKGFVKNPLSAPAFGQNKTLKPCQNNVVINSASVANSLNPRLPSGFEICSSSLRSSTVTTGLGIISLRKRSLFGSFLFASKQTPFPPAYFGSTLFCDPASATLGRSHTSTLRPPPINLPRLTPHASL